MANGRVASSSLTGDAIWSNEQLARVVCVEVSGSFRFRLLSAGDVPTQNAADGRAVCSCLKWPQAVSGVLSLAATVIYRMLERCLSLRALGRAARNGAT